MKVSIIAAKAANQSIGLAGKLPWHLPGDMAWFRDKTMGKPCLIGRKTWDSFPRKPLPGRTNIVITRDASFSAPGALTARSLDAALDMARETGAEEAMILGGAQIYAETLDRADRIYLTEITVPFPGDTFFPLFNQRRWKVAFREDHLDANPPHVFYVLDRKN
jgi:dihydrofolate reductase